MLSTVMQMQFNWLFVYMLHSAAHGGSLTSSSGKKKKRLAVVFSLKLQYSTHFSFHSCFSSCTPVAQACHPVCHRLPGNCVFNPPSVEKELTVLHQVQHGGPTAAVANTLVGVTLHLPTMCGSDLTQQRTAGPRPRCCTMVAQAFWLRDQLGFKEL